jgi:hypothetical protein
VVSPNGLKGEFDIIADGTDPTAAVEQTWYGPLGRGGVAPASADPVGAFRFNCGAGYVLKKDDPIVYPGQPGVSHLHEEFGNSSFNANQNYTLIRTGGGTNCGDPANPVNRSEYWNPAMLDGAGNVVLEDYDNVYYKREPASTPECNGPPDDTHLGFCVGLPNGIRYLTGYNIKNGTGGTSDVNSPDYWNMYIQCWGAEDGSVASPTGAQFHSMAELVKAGCPVGAQVVVITISPDCWDGKNLDVADSRSHMSYSTGPYVAVAGQRACPVTHPHKIPSLQRQHHFTSDANFVAGKWTLSCAMPGEDGFKCWHADYWEGWNPVIKARWTTNCIDGHRSCAGGDLGDGYQIKGMSAPSGGWPKHRLVPLSPIP